MINKTHKTRGNMKALKCEYKKIDRITFYRYYSQTTNRLVGYGMKHEDAKSTLKVTKDFFMQRINEG